jgi:hypothetical protein
MDINLTTYQFEQDTSVYIQGKYVTDIVEVSPGILVAASYSDCSYYTIDIEKKEEKFLCKGFSPYAMCLTLFPEFDYESFPFILAKEDDFISILNVRSGLIMGLC